MANPHNFPRLFSPLLQCHLVAIYPQETSVRFVIPKHNVTDGAGAIKLAKTICPAVKKIEIMQSNEIIYAYRLHESTQEWRLENYRSGLSPSNAYYTAQAEASND